MSSPTLTVDLDALVANWRALDAMTEGETGAVVKADAYGLGAARIGRTLMRAGAKKFFVALAEEGATLRSELGPGPEIFVLSGHMSGDTDMISDTDLTPILNSVDQLLRHVEALPGHPFGVQLDTGMNRLGMEASEWAAVRDIALAQSPRLIMSHLACADDATHAMNAAQLAEFTQMTEGVIAPRSLSATGGILLGSDFHFALTRPGIGLYGGAPFADARPVVTLDIPVIQTRDVNLGETVGYGNTWTATRPSRIATIAAGYADGLQRILAAKTSLWFGDQTCPIVGRISMDMIGVDITDLKETPGSLQILNGDQTIDMLAQNAGTIGYEILTSLSPRYHRRYRGG